MTTTTTRGHSLRGHSLAKATAAVVLGIGLAISAGPAQAQGGEAYLTKSWPNDPDAIVQIVGVGTALRTMADTCGVRVGDIAKPLFTEGRTSCNGGPDGSTLTVSTEPLSEFVQPFVA